MTPQELIENFEFLESWEDRYVYLLDLAKKMEPMPDTLKTDDTKVEGCVSQVWMLSKVEDGKINVVADSDAMIVRGLLAVLLELVNGKSTEEVSAIDFEDTFARINLASHLSPNRRNGFVAMVNRIKECTN